MDLKEHARDLVAQMERDLGTRLEWAAIDHHDTDNPHVHILIRGITEAGNALSIDRNYIKSGIRDRSQEIASRKLGLRVERDILESRARVVTRDQFTEIDRALIGRADARNVVTLNDKPHRNEGAHERQAQNMARLRFLESMGLALIHRKLQVHVVAPEAVPMERVLGPQVGEYLHRLHERNGVVCHLQQSVVAIDEGRVVLKDGNALEADLVVIGIGVRPLIDLAERAGIKIDKGVLVNEHLETSIPQIYAAGDIARWPDPLTGDHIRVEHWLVAERQGQTAARNILGGRERFDTAPFFWTTQYDFTLNYVGHAETWDKLDLEGSIEEHDCKLSFLRGGKTLAVATIGRDRLDDDKAIAPLGPPAREQDPKQPIPGAKARATRSAAVQHCDLMAQSYPF